MNSTRPARAETYFFKGFHIPINLMMLTGGGPDTFDIISGQHFSNVSRFAGLEPQFTVVEVGCGIGRDAIPLTEILTCGRYVGVDVIRESIDWCNANIARKFPNFSFHHLDVRDQLHNPKGVLAGTDVVIPVGTGEVDRIILQSVFTHFLPELLEHYLREFQRLLKRDGLVYATCFLVDDAILESARTTDLTQFHLRFEREWTPGCFIHDTRIPTSAVAYTEGLLRKIIHAAGLELVRPPLPGAWSGFHKDPVEGQDVMILRKGSHEPAPEPSVFQKGPPGSAPPAAQRMRSLLQWIRRRW